MKISAIVLSALGLAGLTAGQNGNDPLIVNNRTDLDPAVCIVFSSSYTDALAATHISVPLTPSPVRSNTFVKPTTSIECWRDGYPCNQNGGQRSQRLVADFVVPTPALNARIPPPESFSTRSDVPVPGETGGMPLDTLPPVSEPTGEVSMGILPIFASLGGEQRTYNAPLRISTSEAIVSALPIITSTPAFETSIPYNPHSTWPSHWRGATSEVLANPSQTVHCNGTVSVSSTPQMTSVPPTSSHFAIPPDSRLRIVGTYTGSATSCTSTLGLTPLPISTVSGIIQDPLMTPAPATSSAPSMSVPEGMQERLVYCGTDKCVTIEMSDLASCHGTPTPRSGPAAAPEVTSPPAVTAPVTREPITVTIDCSRHHCHSGMETVYTIIPTPYTHPIVPATSGFTVPPKVTPGGAANKAFVPIDWWRGPNEPNVPEAPKDIKSHSTISSVATDSPCYRHYCPSGHMPKPVLTTLTTTSKPVQPMESASLHFPSVPPSFSTFTA